MTLLPEPDMSKKMWGFYSQQQYDIIARIDEINGRRPEHCIYADALGQEHKVTTVDHDHAQITEVHANFPDAGPIVPLVRWVRNVRP